MGLLKNITVLIVEDNPMFRNLALKLLPPCKKITAANASQGLATFKQYHPDITFLDIGLPDGNGLDVLKEMKQFDPDSFIVMLTMSRVSSDVALAIKRGAAGYVIKPYSPEIIRQYFERFAVYTKQIDDLTPEEKAEFYLEMFSAEDKREEDSMIENPEDLLPSQADILSSWNILFVDDFMNNRVHAKKHIEKMGCKVDITGSAENALNMVKKSNYHLIFMDCGMPDIDGYEAAKKIRHALNQATPRKDIIIIGLADNEAEAKTLKWKEAGMDNYLTKPIEFKKLRKVAEQYAQKHIEQMERSIV